MQPIDGTCLVPEHNLQNISDVMDDLLCSRPPSWNLSEKPATIAAGFKIMCHQIKSLPEESLFWDYLSKNNIKTIINIRRNILLQYTSDLIAFATRQAACWDGNVKHAKINVPIDTLQSELIRIREEKRYILYKSISLDRKIIEYEQFKDNINVVESLLPWLIGSKRYLKSRLSKQNSDDLRNRILNYEEVVDEIHRIKMSHLIDGK